MTCTHQTAIVTLAGSRYGLWSVEALAPSTRKVVAVLPSATEVVRDRLRSLPNVDVIEMGLTQEGDWQSLCARLEGAGEPVDVLIHAAPDDACADCGADAVRTRIVAPWLAAKYSLRLMKGPGRGTVVVQAARPCADEGDPRHFEGELEAVRLATSAALLDAAKAGIRLRLNRLVFDARVHEADFKSAIRVLIDDRSSFMAGAEIGLSGSDSVSGAVREDLAGRTILVTGATSGIGRATAIELGRLGAWVAVGGRKLHLAEETLSLVRAAGGNGMVVPLDVTRDQDWRQAMDKIAAARGALDGLVSNAGESRNRPIAEQSVDELDFLLSVNYRAVLFGMTHAIDLMSKSRGGSIVNITSVAGLRAGPGNSAYGASKAGAIGLTRSFAQAVSRRSPRIRINALQPGFIWSESVAEALGTEGAAAFRAMIEPKTPLGRVGEPVEVARMVAFLLSDAARAIHGQAINVSGGLELAFP